MVLAMEQGWNQDSKACSVPNPVYWKSGTEGEPWKRPLAAV